MAKRSVRPPFAEVVAQVAASDVPKNERWAGRFDPSGRWFDPTGAQLTLHERHITPARAAHAVRGGALVAVEACGCGGDVGCQPEWFTADLPRRAQSARPVYRDGPEPTWIDLWKGPHGYVVLLHGDVSWPGLF